MSGALIVAGTILFLACVVGGLFAIGVFRNKGEGSGGGEGPFASGSGGAGPLGSGTDASFSNGLGGKQLITQDNFAKLEHGMTLEEVQAIIGTGKTANQDDMKTAFGNRTHSGPNGAPEEHWINNGQGPA
jgi:hypothetical protein